MPLPSNIRLRVEFFDKLARTAGFTTLAAQAEHVGLTQGALSKIKNRKSGPDARSIGAILTGFSDWSFEDLFEVVPAADADTEAAA